MSSATPASFHTLPIEIISVILEDAVIYRASYGDNTPKAIKQSLKTVDSVALVCKLFSRVLFGNQPYNKDSEQNESNQSASSAFEDSSQRIWKSLSGERWLASTNVHVRNWRKFYQKR
jgi:hypothetical protein